MEELRLALVLGIVVICVVAATRPQPRTRSSSRAANRPLENDKTRAGESTERPSFSLPRLYRNRWDRIDLSRAIGRDFAESDSTLRWPGGTITPRL